MKKYESLSHFLEINYSSYIKQVLLDYIKENEMYTTKDVYDNKEKNKLDINIQISIPNETYFKAPEYDLDFDIVIEAITSLTELIGDELQTNYFQDRFTLEFSATLKDGLHNVFCKNIHLGDETRPYDKENSVSKFMIPYINKDQYEEYATKFLEMYYPTALKRPTKINVVEIIKKMGLNLLFGVMKEDSFGKMIFTKEKVTRYNFNTVKKEIVSAEPGTILINYLILDLRTYGTLNNTIIHECVHWFLHRKYFELQKLLNSGETSLICYVEEMENPTEAKMKNKYFMELQARQIAPRILMPKIMAIKKFKQIMSRIKKEGEFFSKRRYIRACVSAFANFFGVSIESAKIRLCNIGFNEVLSVLKTVNGKEVIPFNSNIKTKSGQTFIIDAIDAFKVIKNNETIKKLVIDGKFLYVDGFFVINDPKYVKIYKHQKPRLTALALKDVSVCCLLFDLINESVTINFDPELYNFATFSSGGVINEYTKSIDIDTKNPVNKNVIKKASGRSMKEDLDETNEWILEMRRYSTFGDRFTLLLSNNCMCENSDRAVGRKCHIDGKTITNYKEGVTIPDLIHFIKLCGGC